LGSQVESRHVESRTRLAALGVGALGQVRAYEALLAYRLGARVWLLAFNALLAFDVDCFGSVQRSILCCLSISFVLAQCVVALQSASF